MKFYIFAFLSLLLLLSFVKLFLERSSFRNEALDEDFVFIEDIVFDEDGSLASGAVAVDLQLRASKYRLLKETKMKEEIDLAYKEAVKSQSIRDALLAFDPITIPAIIHIVKDPDSSIINEAEGNEQQQIDVMNKAFVENNMGITFELTKVVTHVSSEFWNEPCPRCKGYEGSSAMAEQTREGDGDTLNIWFNNGPPFGFALMGAPFGYPESQDGVVVKHTTIYGGSNSQKNLGTLLIHEVGHWLGLDHTFEGYSCNGDGDGVSDTAPQKSPTNTFSGDISDVDTCPDDNLPDPVSNFMNYVDDPHMNSFTPGQALKSHITWKLARAGDKEYTPTPISVPTMSPINTILTPSANSLTAYPTRGLRPDRDRDRIREEIERTRPPLEVVIEDTINCPAVWPGDGTVCVMIDGFNRKKCIYYEYSADSICTCSSNDLFWTCVNGPDFDEETFTVDIGLSNSEDTTTNIEDIADISINTSSETSSEETSVLSLTEATPDEIPEATPNETLQASPNEIPVLSIVRDSGNPVP